MTCHCTAERGELRTAPSRRGVSLANVQNARPTPGRRPGDTDNKRRLSSEHVSRVPARAGRNTAGRPEEFPTEEDQARERARLHAIIAEMVPWEPTTRARRADLPTASMTSANARAEPTKPTGGTCSPGNGLPSRRKPSDSKQIAAKRHWSWTCGAVDKRRIAIPVPRYAVRSLTLHQLLK